MSTQNVKWNQQSLTFHLENLPPISSIAKQQLHSRLRARRLAQRGTIAFQFHSPSIPLLRHINHQQIFHIKEGRPRLFPSCLPCWSRSRAPCWLPPSCHAHAHHELALRLCLRSLRIRIRLCYLQTPRPKLRANRRCARNCLHASMWLNECAI
jgi:hypothetical protein